jgi:hypothetical protein
VRTLVQTLPLAVLAAAIAACTDSTGSGGAGGTTSTSGSSGGGGAGGAISYCPGTDHLPEVCDGPIDPASRCAPTFAAQIDKACSNVDDLEFTGEHGGCGAFDVTRNGGFYDDLYCFYDPTSHALVGVIHCNDVGSVCGAPCERKGPVSVCCEALPTKCVPK